MCVVSMVTDFYRDKWFDPAPVTPVEPYKPGYNPFDHMQPVIKPGVNITKEQWDEYQELKRKAAEYDVRNDEPHCQKPDISEWEAIVIKVLKDRGLLATTDEDGVISLIEDEL